jgi:NAD(P)-dependent dehydrogenase (short-subunit alcohol dehydrogenase family)
MKDGGQEMATQTIAALFNMTGRGAIVTGGGMGIGKGIAFRLAEAGARVMITDIDLDAASQTVEQIKATGGSAQAIRADAGSAGDASKVVRATVETFGSLDILVNNAGIYPFSAVLEITEEMWDKVHSVNLKGMFFYCQAAAHEMIKAGRGGKIVNIASIDGLHPTPEMVHYNASKGGVVMLTKALALELAPHRILVNAVAPGAIVTPSGRVIAATRLSAGKSIGHTAERIPLGRHGRPDDIAKVVLFLASAGADYMTGSLVLVDGGYLLT